MTRETYISALGYSWLTPFYDTVVRFTIRDHVFKQVLVNQAELRAGHDVLDLGCGTGTLTVLLKRLTPTANVTGVDGDPTILEIADSNACDAGVTLLLEHSMSDALPYDDASFDRVVTSLFFHHLTRASKLRTLAEVRRILKPNGELHVADWGKPASRITRIGSVVVQMLDGRETTGDNFSGMLPELMRSVGFQVQETGIHNTVFGTIRLYRSVLSSIDL